MLTKMAAIKPKRESLMPAKKLQIIEAREMGFCAGVKQAIKKAEEGCQKYGQIQMLGDIVHNENVVQDLSDKGVIVVGSLEDADTSIPLLFRAHGTPVETWKKAQEMGFEIIDATCPLVKDIHNKARILEKEDRQVFIIGDHGHDEVEGIASQIANPIILSEVDDIPDKKFAKAGVVVQSTQDIGDVQNIIGHLIRTIEDLRIFNTICAPTRNRQQAVKQLSQKNDLVIIIGSFTSANTKRLVQVAQTINPNTKQVEGADDLKPKWFKDIETVGISAGASTPDNIIKEVKRKITSF